VFLINAAELLGLPLIPAYNGATGDQMLHGVNYASAAAGILDDTGRNFVSKLLRFFLFFSVDFIICKRKILGKEIRLEKCL